MNFLFGVIATGARVFARAAITSWKLGAHNAARNGITPEVAAKAAKSKAGDMTIEEAKKILSLRPPITPADIESKFKHLHEINDPSKGGSFYLQSKVMCAKIRLEEALRDKEPLEPQ